MIITEIERLILKHIHIADGEAMDRVFSDAEVAAFHFGRIHPTD